MKPPPVVRTDAPFDEALRAAIKDRGLALHRLRARLGERGHSVGLATLSTWQSGQRVPRESSLGAVAALEEILNLPPSWLVARIPVTSLLSRSPRPNASHTEQIIRKARQINPETAKSIERTSPITVIEHVRIGPNRAMLSNTVMMLLQARTSTDRVLINHGTEPGGTADKLDIINVEGGTLGPIIRRSDSPVILADLLLEQPLHPGETALIRYEIVDRNGLESFEYGRYHVLDGTHYVLEVDFSPQAIPVSVRSFRSVYPGSPNIAEHRIELGPTQRAHYINPSAPASMTGIMWMWR